MKPPLFITLLLMVMSGAVFAQGLTFDDKAYTNVPQKKSALVSTSATLPTSVDLSIYTPSVIDQGELSTCVGVSTTYYMRTMLEANRLGITNKDSIDKIRFSPSFVYNVIKDHTDSTCSEGSYIEDALRYMKKSGAVSFTDQGYPWCDANKKLNPHPDSRILDYIRIFSLAKRDENIVISTKKALSEGVPVIVGIQTTPSIDDLGFWKTLWIRILRFFYIDSKDKLGLWQPEKSKSLRGGHAICLVGYDDDTLRFGDGAFKAVNSKGKDYGDGGYFWIRYKDYINHAKYGFQAYVRPKNDTAKVMLKADISIDFATFISGTDVPFDHHTISNTTATDSIQEQLVAYSLRNPQQTGTQYKFNINVDRQSYLYVLGASNALPNSIDKLFPIDFISPIIGTNTKVVLPSEDLNYQLAEPTGTELWLFLLSETELDIDQYIIEIKKGKGDFTNRIIETFGISLVPYNQVSYNTKKIGFELKGKHEGHIVPLLISLNHIKRKRFGF